MKHSKSYWIIKYATLLCAALALVTAVIPKVLQNRLLHHSTEAGMDLNAAASIGIIGGADGPTAIYVATKFNWTIILAAVLAALSVIGLIVLVIMRRREK